jgi:cobalamin biosynthetic protein CobC
MRARLLERSARLAELLRRYDLSPAGGCRLFQWVRHPHAAQLHDALARQGILTRLFDAPASLRFGLPGEEVQWQRLETALATLMRTSVKT